MDVDLFVRNLATQKEGLLIIEKDPFKEQLKPVNGAPTSVVQAHLITDMSDACVPGGRQDGIIYILEINTVDMHEFEPSVYLISANIRELGPSEKANDTLLWQDDPIAKTPVAIKKA